MRLALCRSSAEPVSATFSLRALLWLVFCNPIHPVESRGQ